MAVLAVVPVLTGTRMPWSVRAAEAMVAVAVGLRAAGAASAGRWWPGVPMLPGVVVVLLLVQGWGMSLVPRSEYDPAAGRITPTAATIGNGDWGTVDAAVTVEAMGRTTATLALFAAACGMARDGRWVRRAYAGLAVGGVLVVGLGLLRRCGITVGRLDPPANQDGFPFGPFAYHGTAGAFLNLAIAAALACVAAARRRATTAAAVVAAAACVGGAFVNVSRAGQVLTGVTVLAWGIWAWARGRARLGGRARTPRWGWVTAAVVVAAVIVAGIVVAAGGRAWDRWQSVGSQLTVDSPRPTLWRICGGLARRAGPFGYGPGTFKLLLPDAAGIETLYAKWIVTRYVPGGPVPIWCNAHQDPLQAVIEWGWAGAAGWAVVVAGGLIVGLGRTRRGGTLTFAAVVAVAVVAAHAMMDFPLQIFCLDLDVAVLVAVLWTARAVVPVNAGRPVVGTDPRKTPD